MAYNKEKEFVFDEEQITAFLKDAKEGLSHASSVDVQAVENIKRVFKKNVSLLERSNVTAWLIKMANTSRRTERTGERSARGERGEPRVPRERSMERPVERTARNADKPQRPQVREHDSLREEHNHAPRVQIDAAVASTIFVGIGRNRRVFPRDLVGLLVSVAGLERERIGEIRVLTNYSFIQLYTEDCEKAINALNGYDYRGRKLSVSYSKQKDGIPLEGDASVVDGAPDQKEVPAAQPDAAPVAEATPAAPVPAVEPTPSEATATAPLVEEVPAAEARPASEAHPAAPVQQEQGATQDVHSTPASVSSSSAESTEQPFSETTDDGQVKSHFGSGAAY